MSTPKNLSNLLVNYAAAGQVRYLQSEIMSQMYDSKTERSSELFDKLELKEIGRLFRKSWGVEESPLFDEWVKDWKFPKLSIRTLVNPSFVVSLIRDSYIREMVNRVVLVCSSRNLILKKNSFGHPELSVGGEIYPLERVVFILNVDNYIDQNTTIAKTLNKIKVADIWKLLAEVERVICYESGIVLDLSKRVMTLYPIRINLPKETKKSNDSADLFIKEKVDEIKISSDRRPSLDFEWENL